MTTELLVKHSKALVGVLTPCLRAVGYSVSESFTQPWFHFLINCQLLPKSLFLLFVVHARGASAKHASVRVSPLFG
jgi:hypothetical protein